MPIEEAKAALASARAEGLVSVGFLGGEPTRYPALPELVRAASELGFERISLCTNGRSLSEPARLEGLLSAGVTRVALSIHSHQAALEDEITGRPGSFGQKLSAIALLVAAREGGRLPHGFALNTVIHARNVSRLGPMAAFFKRRGVTDMRLNFIRPEVPAEIGKDWVPRYSRASSCLQKLLVRNESKLGLRLTITDFPLCMLPWELHVSPKLRERYLGESQDPDTQVTMHRPPSLGPVKEFIWADQRRSELKHKLPVCRVCPIERFCEGLWRGYLEIHGDAEFAEGPSRVSVWVPGPRQDRSRSGGPRRRR
jgi:cyclic pyranopterin phosphate synthase